MNLQGAHVLGIGIFVFLTLAPFVIWAALYGAERWWSFGLRQVVPWIRTLRWIAYGSGVALGVAHFASAHFSHDLTYATAVLTFSLGLSFPENWLKHKVLPTGISGANPRSELS
jgi:hypothetical protein